MNPSPMPSPPADFDLNSVSPGWEGFAATAIVVIATILLILDLVRRIRRMRYQAEIRERLAAESAGAEVGALDEGATKNGNPVAEDNAPAETSSDD